MISSDRFDVLFEKAKKFKHSSMNYTEYDECKNAEILLDCDDLILLIDKSKTHAMLYFATDDFEALIKIIADIPGKLRLHFVPREYAGHLSALGFIEWADLVDFWNADIATTVSSFENEEEAEYLSIDECEEAEAVAKKCVLQSRGFEGVEDLEKYLDDGKIIVCREGAAIAGFCSIKIYNEGTTLQVRVVAVDPAYQGRGMGKKMIRQALGYGVKNGAVKGFLLADRLNANAIGLYNKYGFYAKDEDGELVMVKEG